MAVALRSVLRALGASVLGGGGVLLLLLPWPCGVYAVSRVSHTSPGGGGKARGLVSSHGESVAGGGRPSIITFGRPLVEQQPFPLVLANEKLLAGFQTKGTR